MANGGAQLPTPALRVCILAGGRGHRLGGEKSRVQLAGEPLLSHVLRAARATGLPVSVIRRDDQPGLGPLGGMVTAMRRFRAEAFVFLACDMPFINAPMITRLADLARATSRPLTYVAENLPGFPLLLQRDHLPVLRDTLDVGPASLRALFTRIEPDRLSPPDGETWRLHNVNRPGDLVEAERLHAEKLR